MHLVLNNKDSKWQSSLSRIAFCLVLEVAVLMHVNGILLENITLPL